MPQLIETKKKIGSVQNTRKITKAMEMVAANKMRRFQRLAVSSREYAWSLLGGLRLTHSSIADLAFAKTRGTGPRLFVIVTSDKGLCGALNGNAFKTVFRSKEWDATPEEDRLVIAVGRKAHEACKNRGLNLVEGYEGLSEEMTSADALEVVDRIIGTWAERECRDVFIAAPRYVNAFTYTTKLERYLPLTKDMLEARLEGFEGDHAHATEGEGEKFAMLGKLFFEPNEERVMDALARQIVQGLFLSSFFELKASEYSSRMIAMRNATDAASDIIDSLTLDYNKARQAAITQQLAEIVGAADAMN